MNLRLMATLAAVGTFPALALAGPVLHTENFEGADYQGWLVNGNDMIFSGLETGRYMGIPFDTFWGAHLSNTDASNPLIGDVSRHGGALRVQVDVRTFALRNFFGNRISPSYFPLVLQLTDIGDPNDFEDDVSVYLIGGSLPTEGAGWQTRTFTIPDPTSAFLPPGWAGTGYEDSETGELRLPDGRTYADVLASVDDVRITTFVPGYFYGFNFWEVGFDNIRIDRVPAPGSLAVLGAAGLLGARRRRV
ncbi:MAG: hypothetical protein KF912_04475 [Phycisphaeraceae bacterium]|nr:hypothetical protein [Phycisphaeraceae bacterium]QYK47246.1 MAG: hypothetical protein KF838_10695 [Phycisphaeraceae bacterium]